MRTQSVTVTGMLAARAQERPEGTAVELVGVGRLRYAAWNQRAHAVGHGLIARGVRPGDRVVVQASGDWIAFAIGYVGVQAAGAIAVPVLASGGDEHISRVCAEAGAVGVIADAPVGGRPGWSEAVHEIEAGRPSGPTGVEMSGADDAEILFTSGTTGRPKGVVSTHDNLTHAVRQRGDGAPAGPVRTVLHALPPASNAGQSLMVQTLSAAPHTMIVPERFDAEAFLGIAQEFRPDDVVLVPAHALALLRVKARFDLSGVRQVRTTSAPISAATLARLAELFPDASVVNMYTSTESWPARLRMRFDPDRPYSLGRAHGGSEVRIVDAAGEPVPAGVSGSVQLRAEGVRPRRYWNDTGASASVFGAGQWVSTGDVGRLDDAGYFYLEDRSADTVNVGGRNVSTLAAQGVLEEHPDVEEAAAFGLPHPTLGEYLIAAVIGSDDLDPDQVRSFAAARLGEADAPKRVIRVEQFPRNALGKVVKRELIDTVSALLAQDGGHGEMVGDTERAVAAIWARVLDVAPATIGAEAEWVSLGGSSLEAAEVALIVGDELGRDVPERVLNTNPTVRAYAAAVDGAPLVNDDELRSISRVSRGVAG
ncbi:AMP-binding protein [Myceligenerans pegani]|uniref:AMP-binding protein n=1 Tax=Myceligenerans pegani TaxID=2776917 RepID=A0ABR9N5C1_9MICO|nr:AMP-binding protein [Myceligenerans sp. TRM 65318]MBE1878319.1 AMP-binding protein [Myceligenerans sp. TRM 65318]MBE3020590.1 AMP-binding protein [Myceligenerans sp. TRM 65318]